MHNLFKKLLVTISLAITPSIISANNPLPHMGSHIGAYAMGAEAKSIGGDAAKKLTGLLHTDALSDWFTSDLLGRILDELNESFAIQDDLLVTTTHLLENYIADRLDRTASAEKEAAKSLEHDIIQTLGLTTKTDIQTASRIIKSMIARINGNLLGQQKIVEKAWDRALASLMKEGLVVPVGNDLVMADKMKEVLGDYDAGTKVTLTQKLYDAWPYDTRTTMYNAATIAHYILEIFNSNNSHTQTMILQHTFHSTIPTCGSHDTYCLLNNGSIKPVGMSEINQMAYDAILQASLELSLVIVGIVGTKLALHYSHKGVHNGLELLKQIACIKAFFTAHNVVMPVMEKALEKLFETYIGGGSLSLGRELFFIVMQQMHIAQYGQDMSLEFENELRKKEGFWEQFMFAYESGAFGGQKKFFAQLAHEAHHVFHPGINVA